MTKYVLNSGNVRGNKEKAKKYFAEVFMGLGKEPKVLLCFFAIINKVKTKTSVEIKVAEKLSWDSEVKKDLDGEEKLFVYLDMLCEYVAGEPQLSEGIEKLEWVPINDLDNYDIVPPSRILFKELGYLK